MLRFVAVPLIRLSQHCPADVKDQNGKHNFTILATNEGYAYYYDLIHFFYMLL
jgi:hypothetical protein